MTGTAAARRLAFLHTSPVHVETFERLVKAADPAVQTEHVVMEALLADALLVGADEPALVGRVHRAMADAATRSGADIVVCTCSTIGGAAERTPTEGRFKALRIDRPMADRAVALGPRILLVAALDSTLGPSTALLHESAVRVGATVEVIAMLVDGAWGSYQLGNLDAYIATVASAVRASAGNADVVVLAQASMAPVVDVLRDFSIKVLSSPALGVQDAMAMLAA